MADRQYGPPTWPPTSTRGQHQVPLSPQRPPATPRHTPRHSNGEGRTGHAPQPPEPARRRTRRPDASPWHWLLLVPIVLPLMPGLYNRIEPTLLGLPFFYWCQLGFAFLASAIIAVVHLKAR